MALTPAPMAWKILPKSVFRTRKAKVNWRPMPQRMRRSLMAAFVGGEEPGNGEDRGETEQSGEALHQLAPREPALKTWCNL